MCFQNTVTQADLGHKGSDPGLRGNGIKPMHPDTTASSREESMEYISWDRLG